MPLTWDWPVCVFVHRIFIFIQFSLFENARSMMHLTDFFKKGKPAYFVQKIPTSSLLFTRCFAYV